MNRKPNAYERAIIWYGNSNNRAKVHYYYWWSLMVINLTTSMLISYVGWANSASEEVRPTVIITFGMALVCYLFLMFWSKYRWDAEEYAKLRETRLRDIGRNLKKPSSKKKSEEKEDKE